MRPGRSAAGMAPGASTTSAVGLRDDAQAIADGLECHRRADASPWAILGWGLASEEVHAEAAE